VNSIEPSENINENLGFAQRLKKIDDNIVALKKERSSSWQRWIEVLSKLILPIILFWLAFSLKDSVQQALEYRRLEVESAEAIEKLLQTLHQEEVEIGKATAATLTLSAYGQAAVMPLVGALEYGSSNTETAAKQGLFVIGLSHPEAVSQILETVLEKREGQFRWQTHQAAIEILGKIKHSKVPDALSTYGAILEKSAKEGLDGWKQMVRGADKENYEETQKTLRTAFKAYNIDWNPAS